MTTVFASPVSGGRETCAASFEIAEPSTQVDAVSNNVGHRMRQPSSRCRGRPQRVRAQSRTFRDERFLQVYEKPPAVLDEGILKHGEAACDV